MKNKKRFLVSAAFAAFLALTPIVVSCKQGESSKKLNFQADSFEDKVVFQSAQGTIWPLMTGLSELIKIYNQEYKNDADFLPVELQDQSITKTFSEDTLARDTLSKIHGGNNNDIPNILLNNPSGAFLISQYERLLDFEGTKIKGELFGEVLRKTHSKIPGSNVEKLYALPFDVTTVDAVLYNLDIMAHIFEQIRAGGGKVNLSETNPLKMKIDKAKTEGNSEIPEGKIWRYLMAKSNQAFSGYEVKDETFESYEAIQEFASKVYDGLELQKNLSDEIKAKIASDADAKVFRMDYQDLTFGKFLYDRLNAYEGKNPYLWDFENPDPSKGITGRNLKYNFKNDPRVKEIFLNAYNDFVKDNKQKIVSGSGTSAKRLKSIYYSTKGHNDWSGSDVTRYNSAFAYTTKLGYTNYYNSSTLKQSVLRGFSGNAQEQEKRWKDLEKGFTRIEDFWLTRQTTKLQKNSQNRLFNYGGSSLVAIKTTQKRDKATIKFLEWIFTGDLPEKHGGGKVKDLLRNRSRYIVPTADKISEQERDKVQKLIDEQDKLFKDLKAKENKSAEEIAQMDKAEEQRNYFISARLTIDDILASVKAKEQTRFIYNDDYTSQIWTKITQILLNSTKSGEKPLTKEEFWAELEKIQ
ncbi:LIPOPROTEIN [Mycoplasmopsis pulmonis]|uniref:LIPOPROTEIN n=1 Tax=Mycoplasmopsis pulmonis (strain UAB CTIP) TaxID=272635 RepID=Q98QP3_MYCPU|nr:hypothetical protein [Mycoplasmopsis pulmonis]MDZ7293277.1 hypothetical protein [Mycoplasmopsis pulmonis]CAC13491.1 LIPOPROTEIN [Mycoplasmopsis pulmonis]